MTPSLSVFSAAEETPSASAIVDEHGTLSWEALAIEAGRAAAWLRASGPLPERLALLATADRATLTLFHACVALGIAVAPIDLRFSTRERQAALDVISARGMTPAEPARWMSLSPERPTAIADDARPLAVVFTSGSTGRPRAVELSRAAFLASAQGTSARLELGPDDRWLLALPFTHIGGLSILTRCLFARSAVVVAALTPFRAGDAVRAIARHHVTRMSIVPIQLDRLLAHEPAWAVPASLRTILVGGAATMRRTLTGARTRGWPVVTSYGLTEACSQVALDGRLLPGLEVRIVDGKIAIRGPTLLTRYLGQEETIAPAPVDHEGWLTTNDLGRIGDDGRLECLGRADDVIVTGGEKVVPREVEDAALEYPGVTAACAVGVASAEWGAEVALAVVANGDLDLGALGVFMGERLARWKQPRHLRRLPALPERGVGKIDRRAVAELFSA